MEKIDLNIEGAIARITLQRPEKLNAIDPTLLRGLEAAAASIDHHTDVRVAILTGAGTRAFCVGADIHAWAALQPLDMWRQWIREGHRIMDRLAGLRVPLIAAINGFAFGGGLELALTADIRIAAASAQFAMPEAAIATVPGWGGTTRLSASVGAARAKELIFTGRRIDADTACRWGLVNRVAASDQLQGEAAAVAAQIAAQAPVAVQLAKACLNGDTREAMASTVAAFTEDAQEGLASFRERRPGIFKGA